MKDVIEMMRKWNLNAVHLRYFGLFNPTSKLASIVSDSLVALYNPQLAAWSHSTIANEIEQFTLKQIMPKFGFDPDNHMANFTTGGAIENEFTDS